MYMNKSIGVHVNIYVGMYMCMDKCIGTRSPCMCTHIYVYRCIFCILQNLILRTRSCVIGFITQSGWVFHFHLTESVRWKWCVLAVCQFRKGLSAGPALKYFTWFIGAGGGTRSRCMCTNIFMHTDACMYTDKCIHTHTYMCIRMDVYVRALMNIQALVAAIHTRTDVCLHVCLTESVRWKWFERGSNHSNSGYQRLMIWIQALALVARYTDIYICICRWIKMIRRW